jgi:hypothetical protein
MDEKSSPRELEVGKGCLWKRILFKDASTYISPFQQRTRLRGSHNLRLAAITIGSNFKKTLLATKKGG